MSKLNETGEIARGLANHCAYSRDLAQNESIFLNFIDEEDKIDDQKVDKWIQLKTNLLQLNSEAEDDFTTTLNSYNIDIINKNRSEIWAMFNPNSKLQLDLIIEQTEPLSEDQLERISKKFNDTFQNEKDRYEWRTWAGSYSRSTNECMQLIHQSKIKLQNKLDALEMLTKVIDKFWKIHTQELNIELKKVEDKNDVSWIFRLKSRSINSQKSRIPNLRQDIIFSKLQSDNNNTFINSFFDEK